MTRETLAKAYELGSAASSLIWPAVSALTKLPNIIAVPTIFAAGIATGLYDACLEPATANEAAAAKIINEGILPLDIGEALIADAIQEHPQLMEQEQKRYQEAYTKWSTLLQQHHKIEDLVQIIRTDPQSIKHLDKIYGAISDNIASVSSTQPQLHQRMQEVAASVYALQEVLETDILTITYSIAQALGESMGKWGLQQAQEIASVDTATQVRSSIKQLSGTGAATLHVFLQATYACKEISSACWSSLATGMQVGANEAWMGTKLAPEWQPLSQQEIDLIIAHEHTSLLDATSHMLSVARETGLKIAPSIIETGDAIVTGIHLAMAGISDILFYAGRATGFGVVSTTQQIKEQSFQDSAKDLMAKTVVHEGKNVLPSATPVIAKIDLLKQRNK